MKIFQSKLFSLFITAAILAGLLFLGTAQASSQLTPVHQEEVAAVGTDTAVAVLNEDIVVSITPSQNGDNYLVNDTASNSEVLQSCKVCVNLNAVISLKTIFIYNSTEVERVSYLLEL